MTHRTILLEALGTGTLVALAVAPSAALAAGALGALAAVVADAWLDQRAELRRQRAENDSVVKQLDEVRADLKALREKLNIQGLASGLGRRP